MRHEPLEILGAPLKILMRRQLTGCVCVLLALIVAPGCRDHNRETAHAATPAQAAPAETASPAPLRSPMSAAAVGRAPHHIGAMSRQPAPKPSESPSKDSLSARVDSTTTTTVAPPAPLPVPAAPPAAPAPSKLALALARLPFGDKERLEYQVKYGFLGVGSAVLEVLGLDSVRSAPAVHATFTVKGGIRIYRVNDTYESWFDPQSFSTLRAVQNIDEGSYDRQRVFDFFPDRQTLSENGKPETPTVADPLDEASFLFFLRSIPLEVGQTYEFARYFRPDKNPVKVVVVRRDTVNVPAGRFATIVVRPVIKTSGIFGEGGRAEVWFTDDSTRTLVQLKSQLKFGSLNLYLRNRRPGMPWVGAATATGPTK